MVCTSDICPIALNSKCVFYESSALPNTGIATNDSLQVALQKIEAAVAAAGEGTITSVNGDTGPAVVLTAADVGAAASGDNISIFTNDSGYITGAIADADYWKTAGTTTLSGAVNINNNGANGLTFLGDGTSGNFIRISNTDGLFDEGRINITLDTVDLWYGSVPGTPTSRILINSSGSTFTNKAFFDSNGTNAGINVGTHTADPSALSNGDIWYDSVTNKFRARENGASVDLIGAGGGITNTAANNELMKSDGTDAVPSGLFSTVDGNITLGTGLVTIDRIITADGTGADIALDIITKGTGELTLSVNGSTAVLSTNDFRITLPSMVFGIDGSVYSSNRTSSVTNTIEAGFKITHLTSGIPTVGIGVSLEFKVETAPSNIEIGARIEAVTTDVTLGSEDFDLVFRTMAAGAAATEALKISSTGNLTIGAGKAAGTRLITSSGGGLTLLTSSSGNLTLNCGLGSYSQSGTTGYATIYSGGSSTPGSRTLTVNEFIAAAGATIQYPFRIEASTNSGWAAGRGVGMEFFMDTGGANDEIGGIIEVVSTDLTAASEDFDMVVKIMAAGAAATEKLRIKGNSGAAITLYQVNNGSAYSITNGVTDRTYDANATTLDELADIVYTLIQDLKLTNIIA